MPERAGPRDAHVTAQLTARERARAQFASREGTESAVLLGSGAAALACTLRALLRTGDHLVACEWLEPATRVFLADELPTLGIGITFVDPRETRSWRRALTRTTRAVFVEAPVRADGRVVDLNPCRTLARELGLAFVVDATAAPAPLSHPTQHGADVVLHDAQQLILDDPTLDAGIVCSTQAVVDEVAATARRWGAAAHVALHDAFVRSMTSLDARLARRAANAAHAAAWLTSHGGTAGRIRVHHPVGDARSTFVTFTLAGASHSDGLRDAAYAVVPGHSRLSFPTPPGEPSPDELHLRLDAGLEEPSALDAWLAHLLG